MYNDDFKINKMIKKIMIDKDITMAQVAKKRNVSRQTISEQLSKPRMSIDMLCQLANSVGCNIQISCIDQRTGDILDAVTFDAHND